MPKRRKKPKQNKLKILVPVLLVAVLGLTLTFYFSINFQPSIFEGEKRAIIVDSLCLMEPNKDFISQAKQLLEDAGFKVDICMGRNVTVDFYRKLPSMGYKLIVFRVHSAQVFQKTSKLPNGTVVFFTGETYNPMQYMIEMFLEDLKRVKDPFGNEYFAVTPLLLAKSEGKFSDSIVVVDSCYGLANSFMAETLVKKGCKVYIAWDWAVTADYSDKATLKLLEYLCKEKLTIKEAVEKTMETVGPDPTYKSILYYYPTKNGNLKI